MKWKPRSRDSSARFRTPLSPQSRQHGTVKVSVDGFVERAPHAAIKADSDSAAGTIIIL